jgi:hypothetical protein
MRSRRLRLLLSALAWLFVTGCGSSSIVQQWSSPDYVAPRFERIMVIGITRQASMRRSFEDEFVAKLNATGVDAVPSYRFIAADGPVEEARLHEAVKQAGADAIITTRLVQVDRKTQTSPGTYRPGPSGFYRGYAGAWSGYYEPPTVYQYDVFVSETNLFDTKKDRLVWSGTVETKDPRDIQKELSRYVDTVIDALKKRNLLAAR